MACLAQDGVTHEVALAVEHLGRRAIVAAPMDAGSQTL